MIVKWIGPVSFVVLTLLTLVMPYMGRTPQTRPCRAVRHQSGIYDAPGHFHLLGEKSFERKRRGAKRHFQKVLERI